MHSENCFVTLTYSPEMLPLGGTLVVRDFQLFMKRLRKARREPVRFFHCGEYGDQFSRPHYHACLFGCDFPDKVFSHTTGAGEKLYTSAELDRLWQKGLTSCGSVTFESAAYVARYVTKKVTGAGAAAWYERVNRETGEIFSVLPEYTTMSLKPGIGATWFEKFRRDVFPSDEVVMGGRVQRPPRYYDKLLGVGDTPELERIKRDRVLRSAGHYADKTPRRLRDAEIVKEAQLRFLKRKLEG